jgi:hypothetical protein
LQRTQQAEQDPGKGMQPKRVRGNAQTQAVLGQESCRDLHHADPAIITGMKVAKPSNNTSGIGRANRRIMAGLFRFDAQSS